MAIQKHTMMAGFREAKHALAAVRVTVWSTIGQKPNLYLGSLFFTHVVQAAQNDGRQHFLRRYIKTVVPMVGTVTTRTFLKGGNNI